MGRSGSFLVLVQVCKGLEFCKLKGLSSSRGSLWDPKGVEATFLAFPIPFQQRLTMFQLQDLTKRGRKAFPQGDHPTGYGSKAGREGGRWSLSVWVLDYGSPVYLGPKSPYL